MKIPLRAWAILGVLLQILLVLNVFGFNVVPAIVQFEQLVFLFGCGLGFYSFFAWLSGLRAQFNGKRMRDYMNWLSHGGEEQK